MGALIVHRPVALAILTRIVDEGGSVTQAAFDEFFVALPYPAESPTAIHEALADAGLLLADGGSVYLCEGAVQYMGRESWDDRTLEFMPDAIANLDTRRALLSAATHLIDEYTQALCDEEGEAYAREMIVPPAFAGSVDADLAVRLYAAASALITRLMHNIPAGCVAEELIAVRLCTLATTALDLDLDAGNINAAEHAAACGGIGGLWEFFQDEDVALMFQMEDPSDAEAAAESSATQEMGIVDQRLEAWFEPFWGLPDTGHLRRTLADGR